jgi:hypothetical protein
VLWIGFISIVFCLLELDPVDSQTLNYAPVAVGIVLVYRLSLILRALMKGDRSVRKEIATDIAEGGDVRETRGL